MAAAGGVTFSVAQLVEKAEELAGAGEAQAALEFYKRALEMEPENTAVMDDAAQLLLDCNHIEPAISLLTRSIELAPEQGHEKYMNLAQLLQGQDSLSCFGKGIGIMQKTLAAAQAAGQAADPALAALPSQIAVGLSSCAELFMTDLCFEENAEAECTHLLQEAAKVAPDEPQVLLVQAQLLLVQQKEQEALQYLIRSHDLWKDLEEEEKWPSFHVQKTSAKLFYETGQAERAVSIFEGMTLVNKDDSETWYLLGLSYLRAGEDCKRDAAESFRAAQEILEKVPEEERPEGAWEQVSEALAALGPVADGDTEMAD